MIAAQPTTRTIPVTPNTVLPLHNKNRSPLSAPTVKQPSLRVVRCVRPKGLLSDAEIDVLKLLAQGVCIKEIPRRLKTTDSTVASQRGEIKRKLREAMKVEMTDCMLIHYALAVGLAPNAFTPRLMP